jgi:cytochrome P450
MMRLTLRNVGKTLLGADVSSTVDEIGEAVATSARLMGRQIGSPLRMPTWMPNRHSRARQQATRVLQRVILGMVAERRASGEDRGDCLSMLVQARDEEDGSGLTDGEIFDQAVALFVAGYETAAIALAWAFYLLARNPRAEEKLVAELEAALAGRPPAVGDLPNLPYTEMVIKEALRLRPPSWVIGRHAREDVTLGGYRVPAGSLLGISVYTLHRDGRFFPEPERFWPERFSPEREGDIPRYAYIPFGAGPRICIGQRFAMMEMQLVVAAVVQRYQLRLVPGQQIEPEPMILMPPKPGILMALEARGG